MRRVPSISVQTAWEIQNAYNVCYDSHVDGRSCDIRTYIFVSIYLYVIAMPHSLRAIGGDRIMDLTMQVFHASLSSAVLIS